MVTKETAHRDNPRRVALPIPRLTIVGLRHMFKQLFEYMGQSRPMSRQHGRKIQWQTLKPA